MSSSGCFASRLPHDLKAEKFVIGSFLQGYRAKNCFAEWFYDDRLALLWSGLAALDDTGVLSKPVCYLFLEHKRCAFENMQKCHETIEKSGLWSFEAELNYVLLMAYEMASQPALQSFYSEIVLRDHRIRRQIIHAEQHLKECWERAKCQ